MFCWSIYCCGLAIHNIMRKYNTNYPRFHDFAIKLITNRFVTHASRKLTCGFIVTFTRTVLVQMIIQIVICLISYSAENPSTHEPFSFFKQLKQLWNIAVISYACRDTDLITVGSE